MEEKSSIEICGNFYEPHGGREKFSKIIFFSKSTPNDCNFFLFLAVARTHGL